MSKKISLLGIMMAGVLVSFAQSKPDEQRMQQDIEVAENILGTLLRQQISNGKRSFFPMEVKGTYTAGYGVTFRVPRNGAFGMMFIEGSPKVGFSYTISSDYGDEKEGKAAMDKAQREELKAKTAVRTAKPRTKADRDSLAASMEGILLVVAKNFLADYGDVLSQLKADERVTITNRAEDFDGGYFVTWAGDGKYRQNLLSVEAKKDDITQLRQGKMTRDQFLAKLKIVNSEPAGELDPDLEVLSSMFSRLYREDLSKTYYISGGVTYERLKDFGVIYYMRVYSSNENDDYFNMPTVNMKNLSQTERDKKVKELYPKFESDLKENIIEYGRTLRSLKDEEQVVFKVRLTKCAGCGIPEMIEVAVRNSVLKDYSTGKIAKDAALAKVSVKKSGEQ